MNKQCIGDIRTGSGGQSLPFSPAVRAGDFVYLSEQTAMNYQGEIVSGGIEVQAHKVFDVIKTSSFVKNQSFTAQPRLNSSLNQRTNWIANWLGLARNPLQKMAANKEKTDDVSISVNSCDSSRISTFVFEPDSNKCASSSIKTVTWTVFVVVLSIGAICGIGYIVMNSINSSQDDQQIPRHPDPVLETSLHQNGSSFVCFIFEFAINHSCTIQNTLAGRIARARGDNWFGRDDVLL